MSQENVEIVCRVTEMLADAYRTGEPSDELLVLCSRDFRMDASRRVFNPATYDGHDGLRRAIRQIWEAWEDFREEDARLIDVGERVLVCQTITGRGRASGVEVRAPGALLWTVRDDQIVRVEAFFDQAEALKAVGLEE